MVGGRSGVARGARCREGSNDGVLILSFVGSAANGQEKNYLAEGEQPQVIIGERSASVEERDNHT